MNEVIPTVFARNKEEFLLRFNKLKSVSKKLQIDFMDGKFVRAKGIKLTDVPNLKNLKIKFEAHLMVINPEKWIVRLKDKGFKKVIFHTEALKNTLKILKVVDLIKSKKMEAWVAINPDTPEKYLFHILNELDGVLFMGVIPGEENQKFISRVLKKIRNLRKQNQTVKIQVDGGVNLKIAKKLKDVGVDYINSGSFVFNSKNPNVALKKLEEVFK